MIRLFLQTAIPDNHLKWNFLLLAGAGVRTPGLPGEVCTNSGQLHQGQL